MSKRVFLVAWILLLSACQAQSGTVPVVLPTQIPGAVSSATPISDPAEGQSPAVVFSATTLGQPLCYWTALTVYLEQSDLIEGEFPIVFQLHKKESAVAGSGIRPKPDVPTDPVVLGQMPIAPDGKGGLGLNLRESYTSRSGTVIEPKAGDVLSLYGEPSPNKYVWIKDMRVCAPAEPVIPSPRPISTPSVPAPETLPANNPAFTNQKLYTVADRRIDFSTRVQLENENGLIYWFSNPMLPDEISGKVIQSLKPVGDLPPAIATNQTHFLPVFNAQGNGWFVWKEWGESPPSGSSKPPVISNLRPMQQFQSQEPVSQVNGDVSDGQLDDQGKGSLYGLESQRSGNSLNATFNLWRYPVENYRAQTDPELLMSDLPGPPLVDTDSQGNGFILKRVSASAGSVSPAAQVSVVYLKNYKPTGETLELANQRDALAGPILSLQEGNGSIIFPSNGLSEIKQWLIYPVRNYRIYADEKRLLPLTDSQIPIHFHALNVSSKGDGLFVFLDPFREIRVRRIKNFQMTGPYYRLQQTAAEQPNYSEVIENVQVQLNENGYGLIVWQQRDNFKDQMVETEPGVQNIHTQRHVYIRPVRNFQTW